ncbi:MAG: hypothetical protein COA79_12175 [Planctomycetota bacterium]|nr:MAG: hypothetical protein COA79_12175 [Planctomycetota bacterium]
MKFQENVTNALKSSISLRPVVVGLTLQVIFFGLHIFVGLWTEVESLSTSSYYILFSSGFWVLAFIHLYLTKNAADEQNDLEDAEKLRKQKGGKGQLFLTDQFSVESVQQNLKRFEKYFLPILSIVLSIFFLLYGWNTFEKYRYLSTYDMPDNVFKASAFFACLSFFMMISGLYLRGISAGGQIFMRGAATQLLTCALLVGFQAGALICFTAGIIESLKITYIVGFVLPAFVFVELIFNTILYILKPVHGDEVNFPPYDSRFFLLLTSTGSAIQSLNKMVDYQFGFSVSETWVYQLFRKFVLPFVAFQVFIGSFATCFVFINSHEVGVVERYGAISKDINKSTIEPGFHFKLPWPIDIVKRVPVKRVFTIEIGHEDHDHEKMAAANLSAAGHYKEAELFIVRRINPDAVKDENKSLYELLSVSASLQYIPSRNNLRDYLYRFADNPNTTRNEGIVAALENLLHIHITSYLNQQTIEGSVGLRISQWSREFSIYFKKEIKKEIPGIEIINVNFKNIHFPGELKDMMQNSFDSYEKAKATVYKAHAIAIQTIAVGEKEKLSLNIKQELEIHRRMIDLRNQKNYILNVGQIHKQYPELFKSFELFSLFEDIYAKADIDFISKDAKLDIEDLGDGKDELIIGN